MLSATHRINLAEHAARAINFHTTDSGILYKRIDRLRMGFFSTIGRVWYAGFNRENRNLLAAVSDFDTVIGWARAIEAEVVKHYDMTTEYERTYVAVAPVFAERVYDSLVGASKSQGRGFEQKADPKLVAEWERAALEFIRTQGGDLIADVALVSHALVVKHVSRLVARAIEEGWSINRLKTEVSAKLISIAEYRARRIARTEVMRAANLGSRSAAISTGLKINKEWLTGPSGTGDRHATADYPGLDGQTRALRDPYDVGGYLAQYPLDLSLPPEESINCRCSESYVPIK